MPDSAPRGPDPALPPAVTDLRARTVGATCVGNVVHAGVDTDIDTDTPTATATMATAAEGASPSDDATTVTTIVKAVRREGRAVLATTSPEGTPEAALVGIAALDDGTLIVDALLTSRKVANLRTNPAVAVVVGAGDISMQLEGTGRLTTGSERRALADAYEAQLPGSRAHDPSLAVIAIDVHWVRVYDASGGTPVVTEHVRHHPADGVLLDTRPTSHPSQTC